MLLPVLVVHQRIFLQFFTHCLIVNDNFPAGLCVYHQFQYIQQLPSISTAKRNKCLFLTHRDVFLFQIKILRNRHINQMLQIRLFQRFQDIYLATRQQRRYHFKRRIFSRRTNQRHRPLLHGC